MEVKKYTLKKLNKGLCSVALGTLVVVGASAVNEAKASDEKVEVVKETKEVKSENTKVTKKQVDTAKANLDNKTTEEATQKGKVVGLEKAIVNVLDKVEALKQDKANAEKLLAEATDEKKVEVKKEISTKETKVTEENSKLTTLETTKKSEDKKVEDKATEVKEAKKEVEKSKLAVDVAKKQLENAKEVLAGTNSQQIIDELSNATKEVETSKTKVEKLTEELEQAKASDKARQDEITRLSSEKERATKDLEASTKVLAEKTIKADETKQALDNAKTNLDKVYQELLAKYKKQVEQDVIELEKFKKEKTDENITKLSNDLIKTEARNKLPNTGEATTEVGLLGILLTILSLGLYRRKQR